MGKLKHRAAEEVAYAHMASKWQSQDSNSGPLTQEPILFFFALDRELANFFLKGQMANTLGFVQQQAKSVYYGGASIILNNGIILNTKTILSSKPYKRRWYT